MVNIDNLFKLIDEKGISQSKLAEDTSVSTGNISDWKKRRSMPSAVKLDELATYFNCSVDYLLGRTDDPSMKSETNLSVAGDINAPVVNNSGKMVDSANTPEPNLDEMQQELLSQFGKLDIKDKITFLHQIIQKAEEIK